MKYGGKKWEVIRDSSFSNCKHDLQVASPKLSLISTGMGKEELDKTRKRSFGIDTKEISKNQDIVAHGGIVRKRTESPSLDYHNKFLGGISESIWEGDVTVSCPGHTSWIFTEISVLYLRKVGKVLV